MNRPVRNRQSAASQLSPLQLLLLLNVALTTISSVKGFSLSRAFQDVNQNVGDDMSQYSQEVHLNTQDYEVKPKEQKNQDSSFMSLKLSPSGILNVPRGQRIELTCNVSSSPPARIYWVMGDNPVREVKQLERESIADSDYTAIAREVAKLVLDSVTPLDQGLIHCVGVSSKEIIISEPTVLNIVEGGKNGSGGLVYENHQSSGSAPIITRHRPLVISESGSTVVLPCEAIGEPRPHIHWYHEDGRSMEEPHYSIQSNGDLVITQLQWPDMGGYTCVATSDMGTAEASTFLYPAAKPTETEQRKANAL